VTKHYDQGDELLGERIAVQARNIDKIVIKQGSSRHRIQSTTLRGSAYCVIELPLISVQKISK
jgi:hypothetical protein